jgi:hypothetical protein
MKRSEIAKGVVALTKNDTNTFAATEGLLVGTAGTANITTPKDGNVNDVPLQAGYNPISITKLRLGGSVADVFALYIG